MIDAPLPRMTRTTLVRALVHRPSAAGASASGLDRRFELARLDADHVEAYKSQLGFTGTHPPLGYYYLLAQRAQLGVMLSPGFGFKLAGLVHVSNDTTRLAEPVLHEPWSIDVKVDEEPPLGNGAVYVALTVTLVQRGTARVQVVSRYLARRGSRSGRPAPPSKATVPSGVRFASWHLRPDSGRRYARLSGDYNPIHLWRWSARLLGFEQAIIHGMHSASRAEAEVETYRGHPASTIRVEFRQPIEVGSEVVMHFDPECGRFELWSAGALRVRGEVGA